MIESKLLRGLYNFENLLRIYFEVYNQIQPWFSLNASTKLNDPS